MRPVGSTSSSARYGRTGAGAQALLARDREDLLDEPILGELGDRNGGAHELESRPEGWMVSSPAMAAS